MKRLLIIAFVFVLALPVWAQEEEPATNAPSGYVQTHEYIVHVQRFVNETDPTDTLVIAEVSNVERWIPTGTVEVQGTDEAVVIAAAVAKVLP